jgi:diacylglycerol kinase
MSHRHTLDPPPRRIDRRLNALIASFGYAFAGIWHMVSTQRNAQIHLLAGACAVALGLTLGLERWEWLAVVLVIALVLAAEGMNTAVEAAVDLATSVRHPLAKAAKDVAAGTVLLCAIAAAIVGCIVFIPHLLAILG